MTTTIATTREQSARLLQCGVSADSADMCWTRFESDGEKYEQLGVMDESAYEVASLNPIPAWSLSALLTKVLPSDIDLRMLKLGTGAFNNPNAWSIMYSADLYTEHSDIIEACVLMAEKLTANGYKLNEI